ncbi:MAG: glutamate mutase L [Acidobacteriota bacterium]|nr:glutamate mutase L [Acidobacteriota bacterium]
MPDPVLLSVDIGSTYTKGAVFVPRGEAFDLLAQAAVPTTVDDLGRGFEAVESALQAAAAPAGISRAWFSSSARGGLKIAAVGLTTDLTVSIARQAACSAGGKVVKAYSYRLTRAEIEELEALAPDIVLFTGGTDGGHEKTNLANAEALAASCLDSIILYAGNAKIGDDVLARLKGKTVAVADNVMPEVGEVRIEPARDVIRRVFLERIVDGKGLSRIVRRIGTAPKPTPLAVYDLVRAIPEAVPAWDGLGVIDMGGATTDFYSNLETGRPDDGVLLKGLPEPRIKRTVEGDLGLRVSVLALAASQAREIESRLEAEGLDQAGFEAYLASVAASPEAVPASAVEERYDAVLAGACVRAAALRHAGRQTRLATPQGVFRVQRGRDIGRLRRLVGSGGYLSRCRDAAVLREACLRPDEDPEDRPLLPAAPELYADARYLFPLLGNCVAEYPDAAARTAVREALPLEPTR